MPSSFLVAQLRECLERHPELVAAWLFGSEARGTAGEESDVDVAIFRNAPAPATLVELPVELQADLERAVGRPVDVVIVDEADSDLVHRVLRDGVILVDRDKSARIRFEVKKRNEYFDMEPIRRRVRRTRA